MTIAATMTKAQATGNDFLMFVDADGSYDPQPVEIARVCDRHFGLGADGLIRVTHPRFVHDIDDALRTECEQAGADWFMDYRNADGSMAQMCGNGARATALFIQEHRLADMKVGEPFAIGTRAGVKLLTPLPDDPQLGTHLFRVDLGQWHMGPLGERTVTLPGVAGEGKGTYVDMGNPHVVTVVEDAFSTLPVLDRLGLQEAPDVNPRVPEGQNVEFVRVDDIDDSRDGGEASMRVYERGCGETLSCGSGLCATAVVLRARTGIDHWTIAVRGGTLRVDVTDRSVMLTGPACLVATATLL